MIRRQGSRRLSAAAILVAMLALCLAAQASTADAALQPSGFQIVTPPDIANQSSEVTGIVAPAPNLAYLSVNTININQYGLAFLDRWNGSSWTHVPISVPAATAFDLIKAIAGSSASNIWVGSIVGTQTKYTGTLERYDGHAWHQLAIPAAYRGDQVTKLATSGPDDLWVEFSDVFACPGWDEWLAHWNGHSWQGHGHWSDCSGVETRFAGLFSLAPETGWLIGRFSPGGGVLPVTGCYGPRCPSQPEGCADDHQWVSPFSAAGSVTDTWLVGAGWDFDGFDNTPQAPWVCHWDGHSWTDLSPHYRSWATLDHVFRSSTVLPDGTVWAAGYQAFPGKIEPDLPQIGNLIMERVSTGWLNLSAPNVAGKNDAIDTLVYQPGTTTGMGALGSSEGFNDERGSPMLLYHSSGVSPPREARDSGR